MICPHCKANLEGELIYQTFLKMYNDHEKARSTQQKKVCYWCGTKCGKSWEIDHYTPLSRGGDHLIDNFVIACRTCNARKGPRDPYVFAAQVGRLF